MFEIFTQLQELFVGSELYEQYTIGFGGIALLGGVWWAVGQLLKTVHRAVLLYQDAPKIASVVILVAVILGTAFLATEEALYPHGEPLGQTCPVDKQDR